MKRLGKYWKVILAVLLVGASIPLFWQAKVRQESIAQELLGLTMEIEATQASIDENQLYADVQDKIDPQLEKLQKSRDKLYAHFPSNLLEEDQINFVLSLEKLFGNEITFSYSGLMPIMNLSDGNYVGAVTLAVNFQGTEENFKNMVEKLATDPRATSVQTAYIEYIPDTDNMVAGQLTVTIYTVSATPYEPPKSPDDVPKTGNQA